MENRKNDVILLSTADWDNPFWTNKQHVAIELGKLGYKVLHVDSLGLRQPSMNHSDIRRIFRRMVKSFRLSRRVHENVWVISPLVLPFQKYKSIRKINKLLLAFWIALARYLIGLKKDLLWSYNPITTELLSTGGFKHIVYHCVDEIKNQPGMPSDDIERFEKEFTKKADIIFVTSHRLLETRRLYNPNVFYFSNVADYFHFNKAFDKKTSIPEDLRRLSGPIIGFVGAISEYKVDFQLIEKLALKYPQFHIVLIGKVGEGGPETDTSRLKRVANIHLLGPKPYHELPAYLKGFDVAILPCRVNDYTESMFPMKFFEYLASGRKVVSTHLPALKDFKDIAIIAKDDDEFIKSISEALHSSLDIERQLSIAAKYTYSLRMKKMMDKYNEVVFD